MRRYTIQIVIRGQLLYRHFSSAASAVSCYKTLVEASDEEYSITLGEETLPKTIEAVRMFRKKPWGPLIATDSDTTAWKDDPHVAKLLEKT